MQNPIKDLLEVAKQNGYPLDEEAARLFLAAKTSDDAEVLRHFERHVFVTRSLENFDADFEERWACQLCHDHDNRDAKRGYTTLLMQLGRTESEAQTLADEAEKNIIARKSAA
jgi:hypothetical protein